MKQKILLPDETATRQFAAQTAQTFPHGGIILLSGACGTGKSSFARAFIRHVTHQPDLTVPSPTFTYVQHYDTDHGPLMHLDLYRLEDEEEMWELGWDDVLSRDVTALIEWPERLPSLRPKDSLSLFFEEDGSGRAVTIQENRDTP